MLLIKNVHVVLAYLTVAGFALRGAWSFIDSPLKEQRWVRVAPHVIDTLLLVMGITLAFQLGVSPTGDPWLGTKIVGLLVYIGLGVLAMRGKTRGLKLVGYLGALATVGYMFAVAYTKNPLIL
jgi:uncharacterized membrane protein SirB2